LKAIQACDLDYDIAETPHFDSKSSEGIRTDLRRIPNIRVSSVNNVSGAPVSIMKTNKLRANKFIDIDNGNQS
jgi:hypothetical protein